jgi:3-deoxy-7-phosphoheptulonate synthase
LVYINFESTYAAGGIPCNTIEQLAKEIDYIFGEGSYVIYCKDTKKALFDQKGRITYFVQGMKTAAITEARDATHIEDVIAYSDVIQVGAKAMYDQGILRACAKTQKPVLLKRGFGTTLQEFVQAAEFILSGGNENVVLCERGIRTFETGTRFTLDLCGVAWLQEYTNLPIILDPSHAMGYAYGVPNLAKACVAMGIDGLLIETHRNPKVAKSDASQQLDHTQFENLLHALIPVAESVGFKMV